MVCPECKTGETKVIDSRDDAQAVRRRRECLTCQVRFTTFERIEAASLAVRKRDNRTEPFSREKLLHGIQQAGEKRPAVMANAERIADAIERELHATHKQEVSSATIGQHVCTHLRTLDPVAYLRFASVYRSFEDLEAFETELGKILSEEEVPTETGAGGAG
ncbi:MAG: transcriptional regulator NrdR [Patescibacteria group bacterium]